MNRRTFLSVSALAGAGAVVAPQTAFSAVGSHPAGKPANAPIATRVLGRTGMRIPILSMGVMRADNPAVVRAAYRAGLTHFDTAHGYQNGKNEEMLGAFFQDKDRHSFTIATKGKANPSSDDFEQEYEALFTTSLRRLKMDYVDIFYFHAADDVETLTSPRLLTILKKFKDAGHARHIGFSTHAHKPAQIDAAIASGVFDVCLISYNFKLHILPELNAAIRRGVDAGMGFVAMKTMAGGAEDAEGHKRVDGAACLRWVWQNPDITTAIPGFTSFDLLDNCLEAAHAPDVTPSDADYLAGLQEKEMLYCQHCGNCVSQCVRHLPVPALMRAYMYTFGYKHPSLSKETLQELALTGNECAGCKTCTVHCPSGFKVAEKIAAIAPIVNVPSYYLA
ncbi:MAG: aldo/keto reductase [Prevotellaceae bacterium]|jgi:predicted aldo/keto reductase-like oxidoreductase|nr:aldo/keto reductase [Prevotellaceae bacterium]